MRTRRRLRSSGNQTLRWDNRTTFLALLASIPPLATVIFERWMTVSNGRSSGDGGEVA